MATELTLEPGCAAAAADSQVLVFELGGRGWGLDAHEVREIVRLPALAPVPGAPPLVRGLLLRGGRAYTVLDTARLLDLTHNDQALETVVLLAPPWDQVGLAVAGELRLGRRGPRERCDTERESELLRASVRVRDDEELLVGVLEPESIVMAVERGLATRS